MHADSTHYIPARIRLPQPSRDFVCRAVLVALFVMITHQMKWDWLRFVTSEAILRISSFLGMATERVSSDTIRVHGQFVAFVTSCTFADVVIGAIPLLWDFRKPFLKVFLSIAAFAVLLFSFNLVRLELAQILFALGLPWTVADGGIGGVAYFAVWLLIWRYRTWNLTSSPRPVP